MQDRVGERHGRWTILSHLPDSRALAKCACGTIKSVRIGALVSKVSQSCGCLRGEKLAAQLSKPPATAPHLELNAGNYLYTIWLGMKTRCYNQKHPTYRRYGARGVTIAPEWKYDFRAFANHIGPRPSKDYTVDRIIPSGPYAPGNVRWASKYTQAENRNNNPEVIYRGGTYRLRTIAEQLDLPKSLLFHLYNTLPTLEEAIKVSREMMGGDITNAPTHIDGYTSFIDFTGQQRGEWRVLAYTGKEHRTAPTLWLCQNEDGETRILPSILLKHLPIGKDTSRPPITQPPPTHDDWI